MTIYLRSFIIKNKKHVVIHLRYIMSDMVGLSQGYNKRGRTIQCSSCFVAKNTPSCKRNHNKTALRLSLDEIFANADLMTSHESL